MAGVGLEPSRHRPSLDPGALLTITVQAAPGSPPVQWGEPQHLPPGVAKDRTSSYMQNACKPLSRPMLLLLVMLVSMSPFTPEKTVTGELQGQDLNPRPAGRSSQPSEGYTSWSHVTGESTEAQSARPGGGRPAGARRKLWRDSRRLAGWQEAFPPVLPWLLLCGPVPRLPAFIHDSCSAGPAKWIIPAPGGCLGTAHPSLPHTPAG